MKLKTRHLIYANVIMYKSDSLEFILRDI